jgi:hypothetical protein
VLDGHRALALGDPTSPLAVSRDHGRVLLQPGSGVTINGTRLERPQVLRCGDRVALGEHEFLIIHVDG